MVLLDGLGIPAVGEMVEDNSDDLHVGVHPDQLIKADCEIVAAGTMRRCSRKTRGLAKYEICRRYWSWHNSPNESQPTIFWSLTRDRVTLRARADQGGGAR